jgi:nucleoside 2-deoxyribosyltransferase
VRHVEGRKRLQIVMAIGSDPRHLEKQAAMRRGADRAGIAVAFPAYERDYRPFSLSDYIDGLRGADAVLADLSGERPSCYYEIGVAEALGLPVFAVATIGTRIHQTGVADVRFYADLRALEDMIAELVLA